VKTNIASHSHYTILKGTQSLIWSDPIVCACTCWPTSSQRREIWDYFWLSSIYLLCPFPSS